MPIYAQSREAAAKDASNAMWHPPASSSMARGGVITPHLAITLLGILFSVVAYPLILSGCSPTDTQCLNASRPENKIFWPVLAAIATIVVARDWRRLSLPPHIVCLLLFLAFAGISVVWAFRPEAAAIRYAQQVMVVGSIVLPALIITGRGDLLRALFLCFAAASVINLFFVFGPPPKLAVQATPGHTGYFSGKNYLGLCAAITLLLSLNEIRHPGLRRVTGVAVAALAILLLERSNAKTALGLAILCPVLAGVAVLARRVLRAPILLLPAIILAAYAVLSNVAGFDVYRISYWVYGDSTFTGRRWIWTFALYQLFQRPLLGWGYQSFWLVGPDAPSVVEAPGWIKTMPNAHNGYIDTTLEMGFVGLALLLAFVVATVHATQRVIDRDATRGWVALSLMFFVIITNGLESMWMRAFEFVWLVFLVLAADVARKASEPAAAVARPATAPPHRTRQRHGAPAQPGTSRPRPIARARRNPATPRRQPTR